MELTQQTRDLEFLDELTVAISELSEDEQLQLLYEYHPTIAFIVKQLKDVN